MNIAMLMQDKLVQGLHRLIGGRPHSARPAPMAVQNAFPRGGMTACLAGASRGTDAINLSPVMASSRPLRVLRVVDRGQTPSGVGRLVISGRMADVCAELDRLAASEAALH